MTQMDADPYTRRPRVDLFVSASMLTLLGFTLWHFFTLPSEFSDVVRLSAATATQLRFADSWWTLMRERLFHLMAVLLLLACASTTGAGVFRVLRLNDRPDLGSALAALAVGLLVVGDAVFACGLVGIFHAGVFWLLILIPGIGGLWLSREWWMQVFFDRRTTPADAHDGWDCFDWALLGLAVLACAINLNAAFLPPYEYDTLNYQLAVPKEYLQNGRITFLPHSFYASMPELVNMLYLWGFVVGSGGSIDRLLAGGDGVPQVLNWSFGILTALATYSLTRFRFGSRPALYAACILYLGPRIYSFSVTGQIESGLCFFAAVAVAEVWRAAEGQDRPALVRGALATGAALSTKYQAVLIVAVPLAISFVAHRVKDLRAATRSILVFSTVALLIVSPWLVKNWYWTGNPVFPILDDMFHSPRWDAARNQKFLDGHVSSLLPHGEH